MTRDDREAEVLARTKAWYAAFAKSTRYSRLPRECQEQAPFVVEAFAHNCHAYLGLAPEDWSLGAVVECCTAILPEKVSAGREFFSAAAPVLSAFFEFLGEQSLLPNGRLLATVAGRCGADIVTRAEDRSAWGPAKQFVMEAREAGVDLRNPAALKAFMVEYNLRLMDPSRCRPRRMWGASQTAAPASSRPGSAREPLADCPCGSGKLFKLCCGRGR